MENDPTTPSSMPWQTRSFLQSSAWADIQKSMGTEVVTIHGKQGLIYGYRLSLGYGQWCLSVPRAEVGESDLPFLVEAGRRAGVVFVRLEPAQNAVTPTSSVRMVAVKNRQPADTLVVQLASPDKMLAGMHTKTRYNCQLGEKRGLQIVSKKDSDVFFRRMQETSARDMFGAHEASYYKAILESPSVRQYTALVAEKPIASIIVFHDATGAIYLHGASAYAERSLMAPYALQWAALQDAYATGLSWYDFWGVAPPLDATSPEAETFFAYSWIKSHPLGGVTRFKAGFGGTPVHYPSAVELSVYPVRHFLYRHVRSFL